MADNINFDFSDREKDIINLIILGYSYKEISDTLFITKSAVKYHISHIIKKTKAVNSVNAVYVLCKSGYFDSIKQV